VLVPATEDETVGWTLWVVENKPNPDPKKPTVRPVLFEYADKYEEPKFYFSNLQIWMAQCVFTPGMYANC